MSGNRHKVFISYHHKDQEEVNNFIKEFDLERDVFISRILGMTDDIINSNNPQYVMSQIRKKYLKDSTVTIVLIGKCTWARRYVDWEIKSSLRRGEYTPNGLLGILLPSMGTSASPPPRLRENLIGKSFDEGYARWYVYPKTKAQLESWIQDAYRARTTRDRLISNSKEMFKYNRNCD